MTIRTIAAVAFFIAILSILGCKAHSNEISRNKDGYTAVIDLRKIAPIGYEISGAHPLILRRGKVTLTIRLSKKIDIPPSEQKWGAKAIAFKPGEHEIDLYKNLHSERLLYTQAPLSIQYGVPTIKVKLMTEKLHTGNYVLGISGDPFFAYCPFRVQ